MNCEKATALISSRLDGEISGDDLRSLDNHLQECPACRATAEAFHLQDHDLRQAMEPRRVAVRQVASQVSQQLSPASPPTTRAWLKRGGTILAVLAACLAGVLLYRHFFPNPPGPQPEQLPGTSLVRLDTLTPRAMPKTAPPVKLDVGGVLATGATERQRRLLPDGSILYVDRNTQGRLTSERSFHLEKGNVYVEAAPQPAGERFTVQTPTRDVVAHGTRFEVQVADQGTGVVVTQGTVQVSDLNEFLVTGQQLTPGAKKIEAAVRTSHLLDWTRDLMDQAASSLVPASQHQGGSLIAYDTNGQEAKLSLRKYHVDVHIEDGFARTTIDQTYFNHHPWRLEGTFNFPLPPDASLSQLTMYVNGDRQEGGMVERKQGRAIYNKIVNSMRDPALLEWVDGTTFKMRVFPLEGRQEKRILLSYTQRLPSLYGQTTYRFPAGHSLQVVRDWSFQARIKDGQGTQVLCPTHPDLTNTMQGADRLVTASAKNARTDRDVVLHLSQGGELARGEAIGFRHADHEGWRYLMARWRPELAMTASRQRRDWVVLYEASADRDPLLARVQIEVFRNLMSQAEHDDTFTVLAANSRVHRFGEHLPASAENVADAVAWMEKIQLIGALDLGSALEQAGGLLNGLENPHLVHLGSGHPGIGRRHERLASLLPPRAKYVGIGVGKRWARAFMKERAEKSGGLVTQINPDEQIAWRTFELLATLNTPRLLNVQVAFEGENQPRVLADQAMLAQGEELCVATRLPLGQGPVPLPGQLVVTGTLDGQPYRRVIPVDLGQGGAGYLPRTWARLEIDRLLADGAAKNQETLIQLSKDSYVMTPFTSLLVLENEAMYKEFNVERGRKDHWAAFPSPDKIPVVYEPDPTQVGDVANAPRDRKPSKPQILQSVLMHVPGQFLRGENEHERGERLTTALGDSQRGRREENNAWYFNGGAYRLAGTALENDKLGLDLGLRLSSHYDFDTNGTTVLQDLDGIISDRRALDFSPDGAKRIVSFANQAQLGQLDRWDMPLSSTTSLTSLEGASKAEMFGVTNFRTPIYAPIRVSDPIGLQFFADAELREETRFEPMFARPALLAANSPQSRLASSSTPSIRVGDDAHPGRYFRLMTGNLERVRDDLLSLAPELNSNRADLQAVLEAEAEPELANVPGRIAPEANALIQRARAAGWVRFTRTGEDNVGETLLFDASGRYIRSRTTETGLTEEVICDGEHIRSFYPHLGLVGEREVSRHHRANFAAAIPHIVVPAADLAHGHDLEIVAPDTVAIVPHNAADKDHYQRHLVFGADGSLAERRVVEMPANKVVLRQILLVDGVSVWDARDREIARHKYTLTPVEEPKLERELAELVVLELPFRQGNVLFPKLNLNAGTGLEGENGCYRYLPRQQAVQLLVHFCLHRNTSAAWQVLQHCFLDHDDLRPGLLVLLASGGTPVGRQEWFSQFVEAHPKSDLVAYFALLHNPLYRDVRLYWPTTLGTGVGIATSPLRRLARFHELAERWQGRTNTLIWDFTRGMHFTQALAFINEKPDSLLSRTLLARLQWQGGLPTGGWSGLADAWGRLDLPGERYRSRYERAVCLHYDRRLEEARQAFLDVARVALDAGVLPPIDDRFYSGVVNAGPTDPWTAWVFGTADHLITKDAHLAVLDLASRCRDLGDPALAQNLLERVQDGVESGERRNALLVAVIDRLLTWGLPEATEKHLTALLADPKLADNPRLYRLAARVAQARQQTDRHFAYLARALDLEVRDLPPVLNLERWRQDYRPLLNHYLERARVLADLGTLADAKARDELRRAVVRAIDQFRAHDPEADGEVRKAGQILRLLGSEDLAWDYLTTPHAGRDEPGNLHGEAADLARSGNSSLAERMFRVACEASPDTASLWWDRAQALRLAGKQTEAEAIFHDLAEGTIAPEDRVYRQRAAWLLKNR